MKTIKLHGIKTTALVLGIMCWISLTGLGLPPGAEADVFDGSDYVSAYAGVFSDAQIPGGQQQSNVQGLYMTHQFVSAQAALQGTLPVFQGYGNGDGYYYYDGSARAAADAASGSLRVWAQCDGYMWLPTGTTPGGGTASASASLRDILYLNWGSRGDFIATIHWNVAGNFYSTSPDSYAWTSLSITTGASTYPVNLGVNDLKDGSANYSYSFNVDVHNSNYHYITLYSQLNAGARLGTANFANSGIFSLDLPPDVTFTSSSGVFLTPAPGALVLFGSGLAGLLLLTRSQRRK
jgi:hypothetical protein